MNKFVKCISEMKTVIRIIQLFIKTISSIFIEVYTGKRIRIYGIEFHYLNLPCQREIFRMFLYLSIHLHTDIELARQQL